MTSPTQRLTELGLSLPALPPALGNFSPAVRTGNLIFLSGQGPRGSDGTFITGKVGKDFDTEAAYQHARLVGLGLLTALHSAIGSLDNVRRIVKLLGMVNATPDFTDHPKVINGCSDLFVSVFGDDGCHARSAVGVGSLPMNFTVEIEAIVAVR